MRPGAVHVCLVGDDPVRVLTPALDPMLQPDEVVLVVSPQMGAHAGWIERVLRPRGIRVTRWPIRDAWDIAQVRARLAQGLAARAQDGLVLNASGGTKPMAIAAFDVFRAADRPVFYVHPVADSVIWLHHPEGAHDHPLADVMDIRIFLAAHGATLEAVAGSDSVPKAYRTLTQTLITHVARFEQALGTLNYLAGTARGSLKSRSAGNVPSHFGELVHHFAEAGVLKPVGDRLHFLDEDARFFAQGGWLEQHVFGVLWGLKGERPIQDLARGVEIAREEGDRSVSNELDVACLADNAMYLFEAKTKHFDRGEGAEVVYKIDTLRDLLGGLHARAMIVSYKPLGDAHRRRARDLGIATCVGSEIAWLREQLLAFIPAARTR